MFLSDATSGACREECVEQAIVPFILALLQGYRCGTCPEEQFTVDGSFRTLESVPHDANAFTQGLVLLEDGTLYEGTGLYGQSTLREVDLNTGVVLRSIDLSSDFFGEGVAYYTQNGQGRLIQITWREKTGFVYDSEDFSRLQTFSFSSTVDQGWGITHDPVRNVFWMTDGSSNLHEWDVTTRRELRRIPVTLQREGDAESTPVSQLNELEWDPETNTVLANVWRTNRIVRIQPETGRVLVDYDLTLLFPIRNPGADVLNGIALTPTMAAEGQAWVTGKKWNKMFRIEFTT